MRRRARAQLPRRRPPAATRTWGRCCRPGRHRSSSTCPATTLFERAQGRRRDRPARRRGVAPRRASSPSGDACQEPERRPAEQRRSAARDRRGAGGVRAQHGRAHARGARAARRQARAAAFNTDFRDRPALVVVRGVDHQRDLRALRPYIRDVRPVLVGVDGGANALLEEGFTPDMIVGDMDSAPEATLRCGAELVVHAYPDGRAPGREHLESLGLPYKIVPAPGTSQDIAMLIAAEKGAQLIVSVGSQFNLVEFLDKNRRGMASTFLTRLRIGEILVDAKGVSRLYRPRPGDRAARLLVARRSGSSRSSPSIAGDAGPARRRRPALAQAPGAARHRRLACRCSTSATTRCRSSRSSSRSSLGLLLGVAIGDKGLVSSAEKDIEESLRGDVRAAQQRVDEELDDKLAAEGEVRAGGLPAARRRAADRSQDRAGVPRTALRRDQHAGAERARSASGAQARRRRRRSASRWRPRSWAARAGTRYETLAAGDDKLWEDFGKRMGVQLTRGGKLLSRERRPLFSAVAGSTGPYDGVVVARNIPDDVKGDDLHRGQRVRAGADARA